MVNDISKIVYAITVMIVLCVYKEIMIITTFDVERPTLGRNEFKADDTRKKQTVLYYNFSRCFHIIFTISV